MFPVEYVIEICHFSVQHCFLKSVSIIILRIGSHGFWLAVVKRTSVHIVSTKWNCAQWCGTVPKWALKLTIICGTPCMLITLRKALIPLSRVFPCRSQDTPCQSHFCVFYRVARALVLTVAVDEGLACCFKNKKSLI